VPLPPLPWRNIWRALRLKGEPDTVRYKVGEP
jgi:hypothetical protein